MKTKTKTKTPKKPGRMTMTPERVALLRRNESGAYESYAKLRGGLVQLHTYGIAAQRKHIVEALKELGYTRIIDESMPEVG